MRLHTMFLLFVIVQYVFEIVQNIVSENEQCQIKFLYFNVLSNGTTFAKLLRSAKRAPITMRAKTY